ncbi:MAG: hypothetical protein ACRDMA_04775 [Solirubrobacterales bacterium]
MRVRRLYPILALVGALAAPPAAQAQAPGVPVVPIPRDPLSGGEELVGRVAEPDPVRTPRVPRHPFMAPNGRNNLHNDPYMTDVYRNLSGPLGRRTTTDSALFVRECGSVTFDRMDRIETICVGVDRPVLALLDPGTFEVLAARDLPPRELGGGDIFTDFSGGGYFYLDHRDRAVAPTTTRHVLVVGQGTGRSFSVERDHDLGGVVPQGDAIISVLPDWDGRIWFASREGRIGWIDPGSGRIVSRALGERIGNSFAVDGGGGVYIVTDAALYRFDARRGQPRTTWRKGYENVGVRKPGQTQAGSGTTPTLMGRRYVAIADNADPMNVVVYKRGRRVGGRRVVCRQPVFERGASATDQSLIATRRSIVVENNFGYTGPTSVAGAATTTPGLERVTIERDGRGCRTVWHSDETAPSVVPKLAAGSGLVFTYTKPDESWYLTAIDYRTGETVYKRLAGSGLGFNNNFAPVTIGPDDTAYVGALGGITMFRDP